MQNYEVDGCAKGRHHFATGTCGEQANMAAATCICGLMFCEADSWDEHVLLACKTRVQYEAATSRNVINITYPGINLSLYYALRICYLYSTVARYHEMISSEFYCESKVCSPS